MLDRIVRPLLVALGAGIAVKFSAYLISKNVGAGLALVIAVVLSAFVVWIGELILL